MLREIGPGGAFVLAIWGKRGCVGGQRWYHSKERWWVPIGSLSSLWQMR